MAVQVKEEGDKSVFTFEKGTHNSVVNTIRRIIIDDVPTFAVEDVEIVSNDSPLFDETFAHRLGLIPLKTDLESYNFKENCSCGGVGCALCEVSMTIHQEEEGYVYAGAIKSNDPQIVPVDEYIPVTKINQEKKVEANLKAILGRGRTHAKWAPAHSFLRENAEEVELVVEPFGQLGSRETYNKAIDILNKKIKELEESL